MWRLWLWQSKSWCPMLSPWTLIISRGSSHRPTSTSVRRRRFVHLLVYTQPHRPPRLSTPQCLPQAQTATVSVCSDQSVLGCTEPLPPGRSRVLGLLHQNGSPWCLHWPGSSRRSQNDQTLKPPYSVWTVKMWTNSSRAASCTLKSPTVVLRSWRGW